MILPSSDATSARLLVAGDTHGNAMWLEVLFNRALENRCDALIQLGDFGYWPHTNDGKRFLRRVEFLAKRVGVPLVWIDGNHENHTLLRELPTRDDGFAEVSPSVLYAPRGHRFTWAGVRCGALGGAFSIDWRRRVPGVSWWAEETIDVTHVEALGASPLDVLFTHDAPAGVPLVGLALPAPDEHRSYANRCQVARAVEVTTPKLLMHGHWHYRYGFDLETPVLAAMATDEFAEIRWRVTRIEGLSSDQERDGGSWGVLDLPTLEFTDGSGLAPDAL